MVGVLAVAPLGRGDRLVAALIGFIIAGAFGSALTMDAFMGGHAPAFVAAALYAGYGLIVGVPFGLWFFD